MPDQQIPQLATLSDDEKHLSFQKAYYAVRQKEKRIYPDHEVKKLPFASNTNPYFKEWKSRAASWEIVKDFIINRGINGLVLDLGCGNGWLVNQLSILTNQPIWGVDINQIELKQAIRLFQSQHIKFVYGDIFQDILPENTFDLIILNSVLQYFQDWNKLIHRLRSHITGQGIIIVMDSPVYREGELDKARLRTRRYYQQIEHPEMAHYYFHHKRSHLQSESVKVLYDPDLWVNRILKKPGSSRPQFPIFVIKKKSHVTA